MNGFQNDLHTPITEKKCLDSGAFNLEINFFGVQNMTYESELVVNEISSSFQVKKSENSEHFTRVFISFKFRVS